MSILSVLEYRGALSCYERRKKNDVRMKRVSRHFRLCSALIIREYVS